MDSLSEFITNSLIDVWKEIVGGIAALVLTKITTSIYWEAPNLDKHELGFRLVPKREPASLRGMIYQTNSQSGMGGTLRDRLNPYIDRMVRGNILWSDVVEFKSHAIKSKSCKSYKHLRTRFLGRKATRIGSDGKKYYLMIPRKLERLKK